MKPRNAGPDPVRARTALLVAAIIAGLFQLCAILVFGVFITSWILFGRVCC